MARLPCTPPRSAAAAAGGGGQARGAWIALPLLPAGAPWARHACNAAAAAPHPPVSHPAASRHVCKCEHGLRAELGSTRHVRHWHAGQLQASIWASLQALRLHHRHHVLAHQALDEGGGVHGRGERHGASATAPLSDPSVGALVHGGVVGAQECISTKHHVKKVLAQGRWSGKSLVPGGLARASAALSGRPASRRRRHGGGGGTRLPAAPSSPAPSPPAL